jgi:hypothetical protein
LVWRRCAVAHLSWEEQFTLDVEYVDQCSLRILAMTVRAVTAAADVDAPSCAPEFIGTGAGDRGGKGAG